MASRSSRTSARDVPPASGQRSPSPLSPTKISRTEEKRQLGMLNDRLAAYIDRVRSLESENQKLSSKVTTLESSHTVQVTNVKMKYDQELAQARKALDETAKDKAKHEIEAGRFRSENEDLKKKLKEKESMIDRLEHSLQRQEDITTDLTNKMNNIQNEKKKAEEDVRQLKPEVARLKNKLEDAQRNIEDETLKRIDLQNKLQTQQEEHKFNNQLLEQQLNETRVRKQIEIEEVDSKAAAKYEQQLASNLKELRDAYESQMAENKVAFTNVYDKKIQDLNSKLASERGKAASSTQELKEMQTKVETMTSRVAEFEATNAALQRRLKDLTDQLDDMGRIHRADMALKDQELNFHKSQMDELTKEYHELLEIKVALDLEIAAYRKLLDGEENRLGLSPGSVETQPTAGRGAKRKRLELEESYTGSSYTSDHHETGPLVIEMIEAGSDCIKLRNTSDQEQALGGLVIKSASDLMETTYKFHRTAKIGANGVVAVYNSESGKDHSPAEGSFVMKEGSWKFGDKILAELVNKDGEVIATRETALSKESSGYTRSFTGEASPGRPELEGNDKCCIM